MDRLSGRDAREPTEKKKLGDGGIDKELKRGGGVGCLPGVDVLGGLSDEEEVQGFQTQTSSGSTARRSGSELQRRHPGG